MLKNFSPAALGINGRQSEMIELALTYGFAGLDVDLHDMYRRSLRTSYEDAAKYLAAAEIEIGIFELGMNLDADDATFTAALGGLHPMIEMGERLHMTRGAVWLPSASDRVGFDDYLPIQTVRIAQIAELLATRNMKLAVGMTAAKDAPGSRQFPFVNTVERFLEVVDGVAAQNVGYLIDTWDWIVGGGAMDQLSEIPVEKITAVRLASVPAEIDLADAKRTDRILPEADSGMPLVKVLKHLKKIGFAGPFSPSCSMSQYRGSTREFVVQKSQEQLDELSVAAGIEVAPLPSEGIEDIPYEPNPI